MRHTKAATNDELKIYMYASCIFQVPVTICRILGTLSSSEELTEIIEGPSRGSMGPTFTGSHNVQFTGLWREMEFSIFKRAEQGACIEVHFEHRTHRAC